MDRLELIPKRFLSKNSVSHVSISGKSAMAPGEPTAGQASIEVCRL